MPVHATAVFASCTSPCRLPLTIDVERRARRRTGSGFPDPAGSRQWHSAVQGDHPPLRLDKAAAGEPIWLLVGGESSNRRNRLTSLFGAYVCSGLISGACEPDLLTLACHAGSGRATLPGQRR
jgi:hypothetical protein